MAGLLRCVTIGQRGNGRARIHAFIPEALQILDGLEYSKISRYADEMDPVDVAGGRAELEYEQVLEKRELDWLKTNKFQ